MIVKDISMLLLIICMMLITSSCFSQVQDSILQTPNSKSTMIKDSQHINQKPDVLNGGFIDIIQTGQMNASARLLRLLIGEPGKFQLPVSIFAGASANSFSIEKQEQDFVSNLINPGAGIFNFSFDGSHRLAGYEEGFTSLRLQYQAGFRFLNYYNSLFFRNTTIFNMIAGLGLTFITGAWEKSKINNLGLFWLNLRGLYSVSPTYAIEEVLPASTNPNILGCSAGIGIEINQTLNVRAFYFHFLNNRKIDAFRQPPLLLSFNYSK